MRSLQPKGGLPIVGQISTKSQVAKPTKSRHGCRRCKQRRRKCGEEKPQCKRCVEDGVTCPGYSKEFRWSSKYEVLQLPSAPAPPSLSLLLPDTTQTSREQRNEDAAQFPSPGLDNTCEQDSDFISPRPADQSPYILDQTLGQDNLFSPTQETDQMLCPIQSPDQVAFESNHHIASFDYSFGVHTENVLPYQVPLSIPNEMQPGEQDDDNDIEEVLGRTQTALMPAARRQRQGSSSGTRAPEDLLRWYYRMTPTQYSDSDLVEHYFGQVCRLYALFDSTKNPFRALVGHNWDSSGSINLAIQSMSCAHLANSDSAMVHVGVTKQRQARISIQNDLQLWRAGSITADRVLLAVLLLGPTVSWHNASDIGLEYLNIARELINAKLSQPKSFVDSNNRALEQFFLHAMIYYEMMISFVDSRDDAAPTDSISLEATLEHLNLNATGGSDSSRGVVKPHPWTGVAPHVQMLFAEVGRIMRRRVRNVHAPLATQDEVNWAMAIEKALIGAAIPGSEDVIDSEDQNTPEDHFIQLAEAYRCAGLLQVYHVFPTVLLSRLMGPNDDENAVSAKARDEYRVNLALHTLGLVEALPISSGTSCLHPILVLTAGSELRYDIDALSPEFSDPLADQRIAAGREFAERRLSELARRLPQQPFLRMIAIMKETWLQMDLFNFEVHWMQVMYERGWETIMG